MFVVSTKRLAYSRNIARLSKFLRYPNYCQSKIEAAQTSAVASKSSANCVSPAGLAAAAACTSDSQAALGDGAEDRDDEYNPKNEGNTSVAGRRKAGV
jgi:hypothetical protein